MMKMFYVGPSTVGMHRAAMMYHQRINRMGTAGNFFKPLLFAGAFFVVGNDHV